MTELFYPQARREGFIVQPMDGEVILHDGEVTHLLNATAAAVWQKCDGHHSPADLARELALEETTVVYALQQLEEKKLLQPSASHTTLFKPMTRREFLKNGALAAAVIPVIKTIQLPGPQGAVSCETCSGNCDCNDFGACTGTCLSNCCVYA